MLNLHRDKEIVRHEPGRDGKILCDHRQDGNDEVTGCVVSPWEGVINFCAVFLRLPNPQKFVKFLGAWAVLSRAQK